MLFVLLSLIKNDVIHCPIINTILHIIVVLFGYEFGTKTK